MAQYGQNRKSTEYKKIQFTRCKLHNHSTIMLPLFGGALSQDHATGLPPYPAFFSLVIECSTISWLFQALLFADSPLVVDSMYNSSWNKWKACSESTPRRRVIGSREWSCWIQCARIVLSVRRITAVSVSVRSWCLATINYADLNDLTLTHSSLPVTK